MGEGMMDGTAVPYSAVYGGNGQAALDGSGREGGCGRLPAGPNSSRMPQARPAPAPLGADGPLIPWSRHAAMATNGIICGLAQRALRRRQDG